MDFSVLSKLFLAAMFSPPGIANFIISTILKKRWQASIAALIAASAFIFMNGAFLASRSTMEYTLAVVTSVLAMMIVSHLAFTIGEKVVRGNKKG